MPNDAKLLLPDGTPCRHLRSEELFQMERRGELEGCVRRKGFLFVGRLKSLPEPTKTLFEGSPSAPTYQDTLRTVGINPKVHSTVDVTYGARQAAAMKIAQWNKNLLIVAMPKPQGTAA